LSKKMWEIADLQISVEKVDIGDSRLEYLWQLARVEADAAKDSLSNMETRSKKLAEEEDRRRYHRAIAETGFAVRPSSSAGHPGRPNA
jgi:hypothetical protein